MNAPLESILRGRRRSWLVTGGAGFIGSHLVDALLSLGQTVRCLDDFSTGRRANLDAVAHGRAGFELIEGDIRDPAACRRACEGVEIVLHEAALGSVPRSIRDPLTTHEVNVTGFLNVLVAARDAGVRRVVYASSSSVYGDSPDLPKVEDRIGNPLSPYAVSKRAGELYAHAARVVYGQELVGLRYFNVFGPRQDPSGPYAAVIPRWFEALSTGGTAYLYGDGLTSRDFCYVDNVVEANLLAATVADPAATGQVFNVACGERTTLEELFRAIRDEVARVRPDARAAEPVRQDFRAGDVRHSLADVGKARALLGYVPARSVRDGIARTAEWFASGRGGGGRAVPPPGPGAPA